MPCVLYFVFCVIKGANFFFQKLYSAVVVVVRCSWDGVGGRVGAGGRVGGGWRGVEGTWGGARGVRGRGAIRGE